MPWAMPSQIAQMPPQITPNSREIGPRPVRTERGATRFDHARGALPEDRPLGLVFRVLPVLRDRVLERALLLRDPGGEDVRVAIFRP